VSEAERRQRQAQGIGDSCNLNRRKMYGVFGSHTRIRLVKPSSLAAFQKALELSPQFWASHEGIAFARFYAGDWASGRDALSKAKAAATQRQDKVNLDVTASAAALAQGKTADALQILDGIGKIEGLLAGDHTFIAVRRAQVLVMSGRAREALAPIAAAMKTIDSGVLPPGPTRNLRRQAPIARVAAEAQLKDITAAKKTSAEHDMEANASPGIAPIQSAMHFGRGLVAVASGNAADARMHFDQCSVTDEWCRWEGVVAAENAGDKAGAAAAREGCSSCTCATRCTRSFARG
jgi:hypothetical protein